uniref:Gypsy retrotransposon integrase-like protein 1 n=1 Tax=Nothobranchius furzeri TaxID=105023 RepID=A0A8C6LIR9_NOTFU
MMKKNVVSNEKTGKLLSGWSFSNIEMCFDVNRAEFIEAQQTVLTLASCLAAAKENADPAPYQFDGEVLVRNWHPLSHGNLGWNSFRQLVVPQKFRSQVLYLALDHFSGHLGKRKTYQRILGNFFWPGMKSDVPRYCQSCHVCQLGGKPNQVIPLAPLHPIPVTGEPFENVILECIGPLPRTQSGNKYLLTLMCATTRNPEAIPLRTLKTKTMIKAMVQFFSSFGLPKSVQTDQGSNFMSKLFAQVLFSLSIKHYKSSAYHPQSQGALECFHQTLKSMLRKCCIDSGKEWDEGLPLLLLAARERVQESTGFSPAELVFGHTVRGPLLLLRERFLSEKSKSSHNLQDYVSSSRERLHKAREAACSALSVSQKKMEEI